MYGKLEITGKIEVVTGMHIGGTNDFAVIGAIDSPVVRDPLTKKPIIPGSTLKGKMRTLLMRQLTKDEKNLPRSHAEDPDVILKMFGDSNNEKYKVGNLIFSDLILSNKEELQKKGARWVTEVKFENTINRVTAVANPRQIERVIRGAEFPLSIIYNVTNFDEIEEDFKILKDGFKLLEYDYIGGHGSRGSGKIKIHGIKVDCVIGEIPGDILAKIEKILN
ncbi:MAG: type III-A CRISPR-associated RAMP protein Csm3 [Fusobacteriaceae bacterium]|jgi:CRISPR-associated protein Csm3|nr:type III-A CRISPR-associated RAMP protein Csm3 [Fusobacteriaceae bacterium]